MTRQQQLVLDAVRAACDHPSAATVYGRVKERMPSIGIATVYRALDRLSRDGLIRRISADGEADRYDKTLSPHGHAVCRLCGRARDVDLSGIEEMIIARAGGRDVRCQIGISEICGLCAQTQGTIVTEKE